LLIISNHIYRSFFKVIINTYAIDVHFILQQKSRISTEKKSKNEVQAGLIVADDDAESAVSEGSPLIRIDVDDSSKAFDGIFLLRFHFIRRF
jgi:hypothetical protein